jgi:cellobiose phosphorylase
MTDVFTPWPGARLLSPSGCSVEIDSNGSLRRFDCGATSLLLFPGSEVEGGPANLYLRRHGDVAESTPLLGPFSKTRFATTSDGRVFVGLGSFCGIDYSLTLRLARRAPAWFWHVSLENTTSNDHVVDLTYAQDIALAPYATVRINEFYVSQYIDHTPLIHATHGVMIASRQNQAAAGRNPWSLIGALGKGTSFATDALQFYGLGCRAGARLPAIDAELPGRRLQHEHSMVVVRDTPVRLAANARATCGFFGVYCEDHPAATSSDDLGRVSKVLALPEAKPPAAGSFPVVPGGAAPRVSLFTSAPDLETIELSDDALRALVTAPWRHVERDDTGALLSLFFGDARHVVLRRKEHRVLRPHGHLLRTGLHISPDECALTSTAWMDGVFHSMLTQGHVSINRFLSTAHSYLGLFRSHGQRVFVQIGADWRLLDTPSAFEMSPHACRWIYRHATGEIHVSAAAGSASHELTLSIEFIAGEPARCLISHHVALNGDDGNAPGPAEWRFDGNAITVGAAPDSDVGRRFPAGRFEIVPLEGTRVEHVGGDELLFDDGRSRQQPFVCVVTAPARRVGLGIRGNLIETSVPAPLLVASADDLTPALSLASAPRGPLADALLRLADIVPWYAHNALVHYLSPRGLEQYSGGGWGTRDVCQGPVELLLALGRAEAIRDVLLRVMQQQNTDGDWPQWFMFFERERTLRTRDSHGDIAFWPLLALAQYLIVSGDAALLDVRVPFFDARGADAGEPATVWEHAQRALALIRERVIPGTSLAAYGHGDWNDSLQPADSRMRERLCSAWTVTLHAQVLTTLARALRGIGRETDASPLEASAAAVKRDFQRLLVSDGVLTGYALFEDAGDVRYLLHPADDRTGVRYSALAMIHAILEDMLTPDQVREHLRLIDAHLSGPDGVRLFDRPMTYHGGPQRLFQRAETATFFGREIGLMYMHAHLRFAQALAHVGAADRFFLALCQANPIGIRSIVPSATLRQANCYYSSSDAAFEDRYQASEQYERVANGTVPLDGGWRVYSSGAGIALGLIVRHFLGIGVEHDALSVDPVIPASLGGLRVRTTVLGRAIEIRYRIKSAGCGVTALALNDQPLSFTTAANPHRRGAAVVAKADFVSRLTGRDDVLAIEME